MFKYYILPLAFIFVCCVLNAQQEKLFINETIKSKVINELTAKFPSNKEQIIKGINQVANFWKEEDGNAEEFEKFCYDNFISDPIMLENYFNKISIALESIYGHYNAMMLETRQQVDLDMGEIFPIDLMFASYDVSSHLSEDFYKNKIAFIILLNFPAYSLLEKTEYAPNWSRKDWAYAKLGNMFSSRIPAEIYQNISEVFVDADSYISEYNIYMGNLIDKQKKTYFPKDLKLITHWGLRDELKSHYGKKDGLNKQKMIYQVMLRIIDQTIPEIVINNPEYIWNPVDNKVYKDNIEVNFQQEKDIRYQKLLNCSNVLKKLDPYYPNNPSHISRKFDMERELPESFVEQLFIELLSSEEIAKVGKLIKKRLGKDLQPFDIWYDGFKSRSSIDENELTKIVSEKYPDIKSFEKDIKNILVKLGFSPEKANFINSKISVDPARGAGHAAGAEMKSYNAHLRTRVPKNGMDYKGFNIATHELGHCVEQTISLQDIDYWMLRSVPNTAFTEAFAFTFQGKDLEILDIKNNDLNKTDFEVLDKAWASFEIMGVSLVDMKVWNWLYKNPTVSSSELKTATINIAKEIWNKYYAPIFGVKDSPILAVYSHMIDAGLYLPDYPIGHLIEFQISQYLKDKNLGTEMERMCKAGNILPNEWMKNAVGSEISVKPLLNAVNLALKNIK
jgi:hypothetical protein